MMDSVNPALLPHTTERYPTQPVMGENSLIYRRDDITVDYKAMHILL